MFEHALTNGRAEQIKLKSQLTSNVELAKAYMSWVDTRDFPSMSSVLYFLVFNAALLKERERKINDRKQKNG